MLFLCWHSCSIDTLTFHQMSFQTHPLTFLSSHPVKLQQKDDPDHSDHLLSQLWITQEISVKHQWDTIYFAVRLCQITFASLCPWSLNTQHTMIKTKVHTYLLWCENDYQRCLHTIVIASIIIWNVNNAVILKTKIKIW